MVRPDVFLLLEIKTDAEREALREAWQQYPGSITNDYIHKDFRAGWAAGRDWARQHAAPPAGDAGEAGQAGEGE